MSNESLNSFLVKQTGVDREELIDETSLEGDLSVYGDDAVELIVAFGKEFHVDVSNFMAADYFSAEGDPVLPAIINFFTGKNEKKVKHLKLKHLQRAIIAGRLDEDIIHF
ncbi:MAG: DUF1493 family protein [Cytophagaceae bacterium]|nr:DUF1493 family protein [Cytophagaceae bacterium]